MTTFVVERHRDGSLHPVGGHRSDEEIARIVALTHWLRCQQGIQFRQIVAELARRGHRVSLGSAHHYATAWTCPECCDE
jgi:hypothetical protein